MELIFLARSGLAYRDHAAVTDDFEIILDLVVSQKSNFTVAKDALLAEIGDIAVIKECSIPFIGVVASIANNKNGTYAIQLSDFKEVLDIDVKATSFSGDLCGFLSDLISKALIDSDDERQNLKYLEVTTSSSVEGSLSYESDSFVNVLELVETLNKAYGIILKTSVSFLRGRFTKITLDIGTVSEAIKLKYDYKALEDLEIKDSDEYSVNKVIYYPKSDNGTHKTTEAFYLLKDGSISRDKDSTNRFNYVSLKSLFYSDDEYPALETKAMEEMSSTSDEHEITFGIKSGNGVLGIFKSSYLGTAVEFHSKDKTYVTLITQIRFDGTLAKCKITLGEHRSSLTDKIKLLTSGKTTNKGSISITGGSDTDGGTY